MRLSRRGAIHSSGVPKVEFSYTGEYTETLITYKGKPWKLLTLISSGVLVPSGKCEILLWLCNGGMKGGRTKVGTNGRVTTTGSNGGMGADFLPATEVSLDAMEYVVVIGAGNSGETKFADLVATTKGSGGGKGRHNDMSGYPREEYDTYNTVGGHVSTVPFGDLENFLKLCAGGGGGGFYFSEFKNYDENWDVTSTDPESYYKGGDGGSDGSDGDTKTPEVKKYADAYGKGGEDGGGDGGKGQESFSYLNSGRGNPGTAYGDGGGGCASNAIQQDGYTYRTWSYQGNHGDGYQGVVYALVPAA